jgi:hypothetical protein
MRSVSGIGLDPIPSRTDQLRGRGHHTVDLGARRCTSQPEPRRARLIGHPHRTPQLTQPAKDLAVIRAQPRSLDPTRLFIDGMRNHRKRMYIQPDT